MSSKLSGPRNSLDAVRLKHKYFLNPFKPYHVGIHCITLFEYSQVSTGFNISTSPLARASEFLKKWLSGKYNLIFTCPNGLADFLSTTQFLCRKMAQIFINMLIMQQNSKENGFTLIKSMINNTRHSGICYNLFRASQK